MTRSLDFIYKQRVMLQPLTTDDEAEEFIGEKITGIFRAWCLTHGLVDESSPIVLVTRVDNVMGLFDVESFKHIEVSDD